MKAIFGFTLFAALAAAFGGESLRPNFVFILGEGHGWSSTSVQMDDAITASRSAFVRTPNLEKLAQAGMRFANFYAPAPRCTPSRAACLTGKSPAQLHMTYVNEGRNDSGDNPKGHVIAPSASTELPTNVATIAELLQRADYATAHFGKWHLGRADPSQHGFDESDGPTSNGGPENVENPHPKQLYRMTERGMDFMARQARAHRPFYLQLSHYAYRQGGDATPEAVTAVKGWGGDRTEREQAQAAADYDLDIALGMLLKKLDELGLAKNTYVVFTTDHGSPGRNPPFAGGKGTISEGGLRVPLIIRGPGVPAGACSHVRVTGEDLFPTIAALAQIAEPLPKGIEGGSIVPALTNPGAGEVERSREEFVVHFPHYDKDTLGPASALYLGNFKLIRVYETEAHKLFDISKDPGERCDLAAQMPTEVKELNQRLTAYLAEVGAQMPRSKGSQDSGRASSRQPSQVSNCNDIPAHLFDLILGRATSNAITLSVLCYADTTGWVAYGAQRGSLTNRTKRRALSQGQAAEFLLSGLQPNTRYFYQFCSALTNSAEFTFHTARSPGSAFTFTVTADSHLDEKTDPPTYQRALAEAFADAPDFHIDLGDTFMAEKHANREEAARQYLAQRYYFGQLCLSAPLFLVLGNHDGESPVGRGANADSLAVWCNLMRKRYFPNPVPDGFYTGNARPHPEAGCLQDYYAWEWGDALFVVLDPFWFTPRQRGQTDNWNRTLGRDQYEWLKRTLEISRARLKFIFIHHLVGGMDSQARGGAEAAPYYEWGGLNADRSDGFAQNRPGWAAPIHRLLVQNKVSIVFHGHDHLYARQELDGIIYQEVPQPGYPGNGKAPRSAAEYGYASGTLLGSPGYLRVTVSPQTASVDYLLSRSGGGLAARYSVPSR